LSQACLDNSCLCSVCIFESSNKEKRCGRLIFAGRYHGWDDHAVTNIPSATVTAQVLDYQMASAYGPDTEVRNGLISSFNFSLVRNIPDENDRLPRQARDKRNENCTPHNPDVSFIACSQEHKPIIATVTLPNLCSANATDPNVCAPARYGDTMCYDNQTDACCENDVRKHFLVFLEGSRLIHR
jgi:hypothetical protein